MHEAFNKERVELHKYTERRDPAHHAAILFTELVAHEVTLEPCFDIARGFVRTTLIR